MTFIILVIVLVAFNVGLVWVATGPRNLATVLPYIERALNAENSGYKVEVKEGWLVWDGWRHPLDIRLRTVNMLTPHQVRFATFPEVSLGIDLLGLLGGKVEPTSLRIRQPIVSLLQDEEGNITFGVSGEASSSALKQDMLPGLLATFISGKGRVLLPKLRAIEVEDADVSIGNVKDGVIFSADNVYIRWRKHWRSGVELQMEANVQQQDLPAMRLEIESSNVASQDISLIVQALHVWPQQLAKLTTGPVSEALSAIRLPISAELTALISPEGNLKQARFTATGDEGQIVSSHFAETIPVKSLLLQAVMTATGEITLEQCKLDLNGPSLNATGRMTRQEADMLFEGEAKLMNATVHHVKPFWPPELAPMSREWVIESIFSGKIPQASITWAVHRSDLDKPQLPDDAIRAQIQFEDASVRFLPEQPPITRAKGTVGVTAVKLDAAVASAQFLDATHLQNGRVYIEDLTLDNPRIDVQFHATSTAPNITRLLSAAPLEHVAKNVNLHVGYIRGTAEGDGKISFYYFAPLDDQGNPRADMGVTYDVQGTFKDMSQPALLSKFDVEGVEGKFAVNNHEVNVDGQGRVNGVAASGKIRYLFEPQEGVDTYIVAEGSGPVEALKRFGYPNFDFVSGMLSAKVNIKQGSTLEHTEAEIDLKDATVAVPFTHWKKPIGIPAAVILTAEKKDGRVYLPKFQFKGDHALAEGSIELTPKGDEIAKIHLTNLKIGENDMALNYEKIPGGHRIYARGAAANITPWLDGDEKGDGFSFRTFPALDLQVDLRKVITGEKRAFTNVEGYMRCNADYCSSADIKGSAAKPFQFTITPVSGGKRTLLITAGDAGAFLKAADIYDNMEVGELTVKGEFDDTQASRPLRGTLHIGEHTITGAPVLAKLLSLASLTGALDTLQGKGITFVRFRAPFTLENDVITVRDGKTHGPALGISIEGAITFPKQTVDLKGTVVPSYTINTVLKHVPVVGDMLTGGGEGVFGARYSITGPSHDPSVSVNPLSILTPGFLRGIFDIFDEESATTPKKSDENRHENAAPVEGVEQKDLAPLP